MAQQCNRETVASLAALTQRLVRGVALCSPPPPSTHLGTFRYFSQAKPKFQTQPNQHLTRFWWQLDCLLSWLKTQQCFVFPFICAIFHQENMPVTGSQTSALCRVPVCVADNACERPQQRLTDQSFIEPFYMKKKKTPKNTKNSKFKQAAVQCDTIVKQVKLHRPTQHIPGSEPTSCSNLLQVSWPWRQIKNERGRTSGACREHETRRVGDTSPPEQWQTNKQKAENAR